MADVKAPMEASTLPTALSAPASERRAMEDHAAWPMLSRLPVKLAVSLPMKPVTVRKLLALTSGQMIESTWGATEDVPLRTGDLQLSWGEFEAVEQKMALRLTRLA